MGRGVFGLGTGEGAWGRNSPILPQDTAGGRPWRAGRMAEGGGSGLFVLALLHFPPPPHPTPALWPFLPTGLGWGRSHSSLPGELPVHRAHWCKLESECAPAGRHSLCWRRPGLVHSLPPPPSTPRSLTAGRHGRGPTTEHRPAQLRHVGCRGAQDARRRDGGS